jgi:hypothetical protein
MLTIHCLWDKIGNEVQKACSALHINKNHMRVIRMGKGVIVLGDTDRSKPCGEKEVLKALGIVKTADKRSVSIYIESAEEKKQNRKTVFFTDDFGEVLAAYSLTPDQIRLLEELQRQEYLSDAIRMTTQSNIEVVEI